MKPYTRRPLSGAADAAGISRSKEIDRNSFLIFLRKLSVRSDRIRVVAQGQRFVANLLQPLTEKYGPTSIDSAFWPEQVRTSNSHDGSSPHHWNEKYGAAAEVVFHDHVNRD